MEQSAAAVSQREATRKRLRPLERKGHRFHIRGGSVRVTVRVRDLTEDVKREVKAALIGIPHEVRPWRTMREGAQSQRT